MSPPANAGSFTLRRSANRDRCQRECAEPPRMTLGYHGYLFVVYGAAALTIQPRVIWHTPSAELTIESISAMAKR